MSTFRLDAIASKLVALGKRDDLGKIEGPRAAVAAIFHESESGGAELFFIRRAEREGDRWSGHFALRGGRSPANEESLSATAVGETHEGVGIDLKKAEFLARFPDLPAFVRRKRGSVVISPVVFAIREPV